MNILNFITMRGIINHWIIRGQQKYILVSKNDEKGYNLKSRRHNFIVPLRSTMKL
jgi:hypothetical protein